VSIKENMKNITDTHEEKIMKLNEELLQNIKKNFQELKVLLKSVNETYENMIYRFYHGSFKVYGVQDMTLKIVEALKDMAPEGTAFQPAWTTESPKNPKTFNFQFEEIFQNGMGKKFSDKHNEKWNEHTRPLLEAFFHAKYFLEMTVRYGKKLKKAPTELPYGWAGLLYFYNLR